MKKVWQTDQPTDEQTDWLTIHRRLVAAKNIINEFYHTDLHSTSYPVDSMRCCRLVGWKVPTNFEVGKDQCNLHWTLPSENKANLRDLIAATGLVILLKLDSNHQLFSPCDLEIWWMTFLEKPLGMPSLLCQALCIVSNPLVNSNWSYSPEALNSGQKRRFFVWCDLEIWWMTLKNNRAHLLSNICVHHFITICRFKLELWSGNS